MLGAINKLACKSRLTAERSIDEEVDEASRQRQLSLSQHGSGEGSESRNIASPRSGRSMSQVSSRSHKSERSGLSGISLKSTAAAIRRISAVSSISSTTGPIATVLGSGPKRDSLALKLLQLMRAGKVVEIKVGGAALSKLVAGNPDFIRVLSKAKSPREFTLEKGSLSLGQVKALGQAIKASGLKDVCMDECFVGDLAGIVELLCSAVNGVEFLQLTRLDTLGIGELGFFVRPASITAQRSQSSSLRGPSTLEAKHVLLEEGKWYYEVTLGSFHQRSLLSIGWADPEFECKETSDAVGDDEHSWGFNPISIRCVHNRERNPFGIPVKSGDIIGCSLDLDGLTMKFSINGVDIGTPFRDLSFVKGLRPVVSASSRARVMINLGTKAPFTYPLKPGYTAVGEWAEQTRQASIERFSEVLGNVLHSNSSLQKLDLSFNAFGDEVPMSPFVDAMGRGSALVSLNLSGNGLHVASCATIARMLKASECRLQELLLDENPIHDSESSPEDSNSKEFYDVLVDALQVNQTIQVLSLQNVGMTVEAGERLADAFVEASSVKSLDISKNPEGSPAFVHALVKNGKPIKLEKFVANSAGLSEDDGDALADLVAGLTHLSISDNALGEAGTLAFFKRLGEAVDLEYLDISSSISGAAASNEFQAALGSLPALKTLKLNSIGLGVKAGGLLADALSEKVTSGMSISHLEVANNALGAENCTHIMNCFSDLSTADFANNEIASSEEGLKLFCDAVRSHGAITSLSIASNALSSSHAKSIASTVLKCSTLSWLDLSHNDIGSSGLATMARALGSNRSLEKLDLQATGLSHDAIDSLIQVLKRNKKLKRINLEKNDFPDEVCTVVNSVLQVWWAPRAQTIASILLEKDPSSLVQRFFHVNRGRKFVWSPVACRMAMKGFPSLMALLAWVEHEALESISVFNCTEDLLFRKCEFDIALPDKFHTTKQLAFEECPGSISIGEEVSCKTLSISKCTGSIQLSDGMKASHSAHFFDLPNLKVFPGEIRVDHNLVIKNCMTLETMNPSIHVADDFGISECPVLYHLAEYIDVGGNVALMDLPNLQSIPDSFRRARGCIFKIESCPQVVTIPMALLDAPGRMSVQNTGVHRAEFTRLNAAAHSQLSWIIGEDEITETFRSVPEAVAFWLRSAGKTEAEEKSSQLGEMLDSHVSGYFRAGVLVFLSKLCLSKEFEYEEMRVGLANRVLEVLEAICSEEVGREDLLVRITDSVNSCGDKVVLALNHCKATILAAQARGNRKAIRELGLAVMRLTVVHRHVEAKIAGMKQSDVDDVCVYLRYEIELREKLGLPVTSEAMLFPDFVKVSPEELKACEDEALLLVDDAPAFNEWLSTWPDWCRQLRLELCESLSFESLPDASEYRQVDLDETRFDGEPMEQPVMLGKGGPWDFEELITRYVETGRDFNNLQWTPDEFEANLGRLSNEQMPSDAEYSESAPEVQRKSSSRTRDSVDARQSKLEHSEDRDGVSDESFEDGDDLDHVEALKKAA